MVYNVLIYEDNTRLRNSLELLLDDGVSFKVVGSFSNCDNVVNEMALHSPQLIIMDIDMPGIGGIEGVKLVKNTNVAVKIIMYTMFDDDKRIFDSICAGADGYLLKNTSPVALSASLLEVMNGGSPMSPFIAKRMFDFFRQQNNTQQPDFNLTKRELEILELLVKGNSYKMIADKSSVTIDTVKKHLQNIYHKLHVNCGTEAVAKALQHKIVKFS
jgi:DNA-binding NarL/FixJ family response regulator